MFIYFTVNIYLRTRLANLDLGTKAKYVNAKDCYCDKILQVDLSKIREREWFVQNAKLRGGGFQRVGLTLSACESSWLLT